MSEIDDTNKQPPLGSIVHKNPINRDLLLRAAAEGYTIQKIAKMCECQINEIYALLNANPQLAVQFEKSRSLGVETLVDQMMEIADTEPDVARAKLKCDNIKWVASKRNTKYGDRVHLDIKDHIDLAAIIASARERSKLQVKTIIDAEVKSQPQTLRNAMSILD